MNLPTQAALARYGAVKVTTASPGQILVMLYDGLMRFLREAHAAMTKGDRARAGGRASRAHAILAYLLATLDAQHAPELCQNLQAIYLFCMDRLRVAGVEQDATKIQEVVRVLSPLHEAWTKAVAEVASAAKGP